MVYIYGGGFFSGTANPGITGPAYFMDTQKVILVTMAYRLGAFGKLERYFLPTSNFVTSTHV